MKIIVLSLPHYLEGTDFKNSKNKSFELKSCIQTDTLPNAIKYIIVVSHGIHGQAIKIFMLYFIGYKIHQKYIHLKNYFYILLKL